MTVITFPGRREHLRMAQATLESSSARAIKRRIPQVMPKLEWPVVCRRGECHHVMCKSRRDQAALPCAECGHVIDAGEQYYVREANRAGVVAHIHVACAGVQEHFL